MYTVFIWLWPTLYKIYITILYYILYIPYIHLLARTVHIIYIYI